MMEGKVVNWLTSRGRTTPDLGDLLDLAASARLPVCGRAAPSAALSELREDER